MSVESTVFVIQPSNLKFVRLKELTLLCLKCRADRGYTSGVIGVCLGPFFVATPGTVVL